METRLSSRFFLLTASFSVKYVLHPLVPELTYDDLVIVDGLVARVEIARLLFVAGKIPQEESTTACGRTCSTTVSGIRGRW
jgi:hypothetical protein